MLSLTCDSFHVLGGGVENYATLVHCGRSTTNPFFTRLKTVSLNTFFVERRSISTSFPRFSVLFVNQRDTYSQNEINFVLERMHRVLHAIK